MKKFYKILGVALWVGMMSGQVLAQEVEVTPVVAPIEKIDEQVTVHQINKEVPISRAEFMITIIQATGEVLPPIMDTHYALPAMERAEQLGLIDLSAYPMETWLEDLSNEEKEEILTKATLNKSIDMQKVYTALNQILVKHVELDGQKVDLKGLALSHYEGKLMLPLRVVAEAMGFEVTWDATKYIATLANESIQSPVQVGFDSYHYRSQKAIGMSAPFSVGAAPKLIEGTVYVPTRYFSMFAEMEVTEGILKLTIKR